MFDLALDWDRSFVLGDRSAAGRTTDCYLRIRVTPRAGAVRQILPAHLAIALDTSSSMADNNKLGRARVALNALVGQVRARDLLSLAGFATGCRERLGRAGGGPNLAGQVQAAVGALAAEGVTRTDLALDWLRQTLGPAGGAGPGVVRIGILITDGQPTDGDGKPLTGPGLAELLGRGEALREAGVSLWAIGVGPAGDFNAGFLEELTAAGFLHAARTEELGPLLGRRLAAVQSMAAADVTLAIVPRLPGLDLGALCRLAPEFSPFDRPRDPARGFRAGSLRHDGETVFMAEFSVPAPAGQALDQPLPAVDVRLAGAGSAEVSATASLTYTASYSKAHKVAEEVDNARLTWQMHRLGVAMVRSEDPGRTMDLAEQLKDVATTLNRADVVADAGAVIDEIARSPAGQEWKNRVTKTTTRLWS